MTTALQRNTLLLDAYLPEFDETRIEHLVIDGPTDAVYEATRNVDFLMVHSPLMDMAMFVRLLPNKVGKLARRDQPPTPTPPSLKLAAMFEDVDPDPGAALEGWIGLAEERGREIVFGAVGKPWMADIEWKTVPVEDFAGFDEPGWAKIAASLSIREYGTERSLVTYEARTAMTDQESRDRFHRYWMVVSPFVGTIMRALLRTVAESTVEGARA